MHFGASLAQVLAPKIKENHKMIRFQEASKRWSIFEWICLVILAPFWHPSWDHVGHFFGSRGATLWGPALFFDALAFFFDFFRRLDPILASFWLYFGPPWTPSWLDLGGFWLYVGTILALRWALWAQELALDALVWWGYAKRQDFSLLMIASSFVL